MKQMTCQQAGKARAIARVHFGMSLVKGLKGIRTAAETARMMQITETRVNDLTGMAIWKLWRLVRGQSIDNRKLNSKA